MKVERYIKKQKSKKYIVELIMQEHRQETLLEKFDYSAEWWSLDYNAGVTFGGFIGIK